MDALKKFVQYLYTDTCHGLSSSTSELLAVAEKYNVPALKLECEEALVSSIRISNSAEILVLAHLHNAGHLLRVALDFVSGHLPAVRRTPGFKELESVAHRDLLLKLLGAWGSSQDASGSSS